MRALYAAKLHIRTAVGGELPFALYLNMFDSQVRPILQYGAEIWYQHKEISRLESVQLCFLKAILGVKRQTSTAAVYEETGRFPLLLSQQEQILKYYCRLKTLDPDKPVVKILHELEKLHNDGYNTWVTNVNNIVTEAGFNINDLTPDSAPFVLSQIKEIQYSKHIQLWLESINNSDKNPVLRTYKVFKDVYSVEPYLIHPSQKKYQVATARFRTSSHKLHIETGRYTRPKTPINERICVFCDQHMIDDEIHMIMRCSFHAAERAIMYTSINDCLQYLDSQSDMSKFQSIIKCKDKQVIKAVGKFLYISFQKRDNTDKTYHGS